MITKRDIYRLINDDPNFLDHLIDSIPSHLNTKQIMSMTGLTERTIQNWRDEEKISCKRLRGSKRTYVYPTLEVIVSAYKPKD